MSDRTTGPGRARAWVAASLWLVSLALAAAGWGDHLQPVVALSAAASASVGALVAGKTGNPTGSWLLAAGIGLGIGAVALAGAPTGLFGTNVSILICSGSFPSARLVAIVAGAAVWAASVVTVVAFFPFGSLTPLRERQIGGRRLLGALALVWSGSALVALAAVISPDRVGTLSVDLLRSPCPMGAGPATVAGLGLIAAGAATTVVSVLQRLRRVSGSDHAQLSPVAWTATVAVIFAAVVTILVPADRDAGWLVVAWVVAGIGIPLSVAVSIVRSRTFGIFRFVGFMADYRIWTGSLGAVATLSVIGATWGVVELTGLDRYPVAVAAIALAFGAAALPMWHRWQRRVDARYGQHQEDPARTLERLADDTRSQDPTALRGPVFDLLERFAPIVIVDGAERMRFALPTDDHEVARHTFVHGAYDLATMRCAMAELGGTLGGGTVLDVGANIGTSIVPLLTVFGASHGIAVEPAPGNLDLLRLNLVLNDIADRVEVLAMGLSDLDGTMELELSADNSGDHRIRVSGVPHDADDLPRSTVDVPVRRMDTLIASGGVDLSRLVLLWLDVQGHEGHVLAGGRALMSTTIPIVTEFWPSAMDRAGGLASFIELVAQHVERVIDLRATQAEGRLVQVPATRIDEVAERYAGPSSFTDLLLLR